MSEGSLTLAQSDIFSDYRYFRQSSLDDTIEETAGPSRVSSSQRSIEVIPARTRNTSISMSDKVGQSPVTLHTSFRCRKVLKNILNIAVKNSEASYKYHVIGIIPLPTMEQEEEESDYIQFFFQ